jgi:uncharacterized protein YcbX
MTPTVLQTFIYPVKSLAGIACDSLYLSDRGARGDRRWMLVDSQGRFISQREWPRLCLLRVAQMDEGFEIVGLNGDSVHIPLGITSGTSSTVTIWSDEVSAIEAEDMVNLFFSREIGMTCKLVYMPDETHRFADSAYAGEGKLTAFSDGFPLLLIGSASLHELNKRIQEVGQSEIGWDRFRPNIVVSTDVPHAEDSWAEFSIGEVEAQGVKLCSRCVMTTIDQSSGVHGKEPLRTLSKYRTMTGKVMFGQNIIAQQGTIRVGDNVSVKRIAFPPNAEF